MKTRLEWQWEILHDSPASSSKRTKVIGGWIVVHQTFYDLGRKNATISDSMVFIEDKEHKWVILPSSEDKGGHICPKKDDDDFDPNNWLA
jgi:hypothetical protein